MRGRTYLILAVALTVVALLNLPAPVAMRIEAGAADNLAPFENVLAVLAQRIHRSLAALANGLGGDDREAARELEMAALREDLRRLPAIERENDELRGLMGFQHRQKRRLAPCEVVSRGDAGGWWEVVRLNRGSDAGIKAGMAVITVDGLVGRTRAVSTHTADVLLITDPGSKVSCRVPRVDALGILSGGGVSARGTHRVEMLADARPCRMDFVRKEARLAPGDPVETSGLGGVYPEGLPVGRIARTELDASRLYQKAEIVPAAKLGRLRYVFVVLE